MGNPSPTPPPSRSFSQVVAKGSFWSLISSATNLLSGLITAPFFIHYLGEGAYGALILIGVVILYAEIADLGITFSCIRHASAAFRSGDYSRVYEVVGTAWLMYASAGIAVALSIGTFAPWLMEKLFTIPPQHLTEAQKALRISLANFALNFTTGVPLTIPTIAGRFDVFGKLSAFRTTSRLLLGIWILIQGGGLVGLVYTYLGIDVLNAMLTFGVARRFLPGFPSQLRIKGRASCELLQLGSIATVNNILNRLIGQWEKTLLGRYAGAERLPPYSVSQTIVSQFVLIPGSIGGSLLPELSALYAKRDLATAMHLLRRAQEIVWLLLFPLVVYLGISAPDLLTLWIGREFAIQAAPLMQILLIGTPLQSLLVLFQVALGAWAKPHRITWVLIGVGILQLPLAFYLVRTWGLYGASWSFVIRYILEFVGTGLAFPGRGVVAALRGLRAKASLWMLGWSLLWGVSYLSFRHSLPSLLHVIGGAILFWGIWAFVMYRWGLRAHELEGLLQSLPLPLIVKKRLLRHQ